METDNNYTKTEQDMLEVVRALYTDVFDSGNCPVVDNYYRNGAPCHFKDRTLTVEEMKESMREFVDMHSEIKTTIESVVVKGDRTFARLRRDVTKRENGEQRSIDIMVEKRFESGKVAELWFMVDDQLYSDTWYKNKVAQ